MKILIKFFTKNITKAVTRAFTKTVTKILWLTVLVVFGFQAQANSVKGEGINLTTTTSENDKRIVMILSGYGEEKGEKAPGYEFDEFSKAYLVFSENGINIDIASPKGGAVEADEYDPNKAYNAKILADNSIMAKLKNTLAISTLNASDYDGIFIVGGKGAMFDLPKDNALQTLIADIYQQQGTVAAVCHGPAALVDVKLKDGSYLINNKKINGFTNNEEQLFGKKWMNQFDFKLEDKLIERGGQFQSSDIMLSHVAIDERLITGQNPTSTTDVAIALVNSLGMKPIETKQSKDDKTLAAVAQFLAGNSKVLEEIKLNEQDYQIPLVGMYGFYYEKTADSDDKVEKALSLMTLAQKTINNPSLDMKIAKTQLKLGQKRQAKSTLKQLLTSKPDYQPALDMIKKVQ